MESVKGTIVSGIVEGAYFMSLEHYKKEIKNKLGFDAYPGTLNVKINGNRDELLKNIRSIIITGYISDNRKFGDVSCYKAKIKSISGAIIIPYINKNPGNIMEFIAPVHIKSELNLKDDDEIEIKFL